MHLESMYLLLLTSTAMNVLSRNIPSGLLAPNAPNVRDLYCNQKLEWIVLVIFTSMSDEIQ